MKKCYYEKAAPQLLNIVKMSSSLVGMASVSKQSNRSAGSGNWSSPGRSNACKDKTILNLQDVCGGPYIVSYYGIFSIMNLPLNQSRYHL